MTTSISHVSGRGFTQDSEQEHQIEEPGEKLQVGVPALRMDQPLGIVGNRCLSRSIS